MRVYRDGAIACPFCARPMTRLSVDAPGGDPVEVDRCASCGGVYFDYNDGETSGLATRLVASASGGAPPLRQARCPECDEPMHPMAYLDTGPELHRCAGCLAAAATPETIRALARFTLEESPAGPLQRWWSALRSLL